MHRAADTLDQGQKVRFVGTSWRRALFPLVACWSGRGV